MIKEVITLFLIPYGDNAILLISEIFVSDFMLPNFPRDAWYVCLSELYSHGVRWLSDICILKESFWIDGIFLHSCFSPITDSNSFKGRILSFHKEMIIVSVLEVFLKLYCTWHDILLIHLSVSYGGKECPLAQIRLVQCLCNSRFSDLRVF